MGSEQKPHNMRQLNAKTGEWEDVQPMKAPRHWPWLQRIVDWLWTGGAAYELGKAAVVVAILVVLWLTRGFWI